MTEKFDDPKGCLLMIVLVVVAVACAAAKYHIEMTKYRAAEKYLKEHPDTKEAP